MRKYFLWLAFIALIFALGCSDPTAIWAPRIDNFTYDEAVNLYGEPTACQELENGDKLCGWYGNSQSGWNKRTVLRFDGYGVLREVPVTGNLE